MAYIYSEHCRLADDKHVGRRETNRRTSQLVEHHQYLQTHTHTPVSYTHLTLPTIYSV